MMSGERQPHFEGIAMQKQEQELQEWIQSQEKMIAVKSLRELGQRWRKIGDIDKTE